MSSLHRSPRLQPSSCYLAQRDLCALYCHSLTSQELGFTNQDLAVDDRECCVYVFNPVLLMTNHTADVAAVAKMGLWAQVSSTTSRISAPFSSRLSIILQLSIEHIFQCATNPQPAIYVFHARRIRLHRRDTRSWLFDSKYNGCGL